MVKKSSGSKSKSRSGSGSGSNKPPKKPTNPPASTPGAPGTSRASGPASPAGEEEDSEEADLKAQQRLLDVFRDAFRDALRSEDFAAVLQAVKQALYDRDFEAAFAHERSLEVYAARWSPTRALCYARVLSQIAGYLEPLLLLLPDEEKERTGDVGATGSDASSSNDEQQQQQPAQPTSAALSDDDTAEETETETQHKRTNTRTLKVLSIGGGAAELAALGAYLQHADPSGTSGATITLLDAGPWGDVVQKLHLGLTTAPALSRYASAGARATNGALVAPPSRLRHVFVQEDVLGLGREELAELLPLGREQRAQSGKGRGRGLLVTMLFTLNELYTSGGIRATTAFLRTLTCVIPAGSLLLVVDSPGSYSEAAVGKEARKYPMQWLLDHTLLQQPQQPSSTGSQGCKWEKLESHDSVWFRLHEKLRYPITLENMRYQMHLYRTYDPRDDGTTASSSLK
ncbi:hypothetical protein AAE478_006708 [Parahypoxylon ruwenzoriense]